MPIVSCPYQAYSAGIKDYRPLIAELYNEDKKLAFICLRKFSRDDKQYYLAVDPDTLRTQIVPVGKHLVQKRPFKEIMERNKGLNYFKAIQRAEKKSRPLKNAGIANISGSNEVYLTADLCPSRRPLDRVLFTQLMSVYGNVHKTAPIALCATGRWMEKHPDDMQWLLDLDRQKKISITWINHSYSHHYQKNLPFWKNFFLHERNTSDSEIFLVEIRLLETGIIPSVFFRFPGLVSNQKVFNMILDLGLIPIGSDAWLGKNEWPKSGSIILVHANGLEPAGMRRFLRFLQSKKKDIEAGKWVLADIREGIYKSMKTN